MAVSPQLSDYPWLRDESPSQCGGLHVQRVSVRWEVPVYFTREAFSWENLSVVRALTRRAPGRRHRLLLVVERTVADAHPNLVADVTRYVAVHRERLALGGETILTSGGRCALLDDELVTHVHGAIREINEDPSAVVVAIGGAALQELVSRARPLRHLRVPTSVQSQIEAAIGPEAGVNAFRPRRSGDLGTPPLAVINDFDFLETVPARGAIAGMAQAVAVALVRDPSFFGWLRLNASVLASREPEVLAHLVRRAAHHPPAEPLEIGLTQRLDFGQWAANELSSLTRGELAKGEALSIGCALDAVYSAACGLLDPEALDPIVSTIEALGLPTYHPALDRDLPGGPRAVLEGLAVMRDGAYGEVALTLIDSIGHGVEAREIDEDLVLRAIDWLRHRVPPARR